MRMLAIFMVLLAAGCGPAEPSPQEKEARDLRDIAMVEAAQKIDPPREPVTPEEILPVDIEDNDLLGVGCSFTPAGQHNPVALGMVGAAYIKVDKQIERLAADKGGEQMPYGTWSKYDGKRYVLRLAKDASDGTPVGSEAVEWSGRMSLLDPYDRPVFESHGTLQCGN